MIMEMPCRRYTLAPQAALGAFFAALALLPYANSALAGAPVAEAIPITSARVWLAPEYTRLTLEASLPVQYTLSTIKNPDRVVIDLEHVLLTPEIEKLGERIDAADPYVRSVRVGRYKPGILRLVVDLKTEAVPQAFILKPVGNYKHRLVLDIYPIVPPDPLMAFLNENANGAPLDESARGTANKAATTDDARAGAAGSRKAKSRMTRRITVA